jgi:hypothetical protein
MSRAKTNGSKSPTSGQLVTQAAHYSLPPHRPRRRRVRIDGPVRRRIEDAIERMIEAIDADAELDEAEQEGGIEDEPHDADTEQDGDAACEVPFMVGGDDPR